MQPQFKNYDYPEYDKTKYRIDYKVNYDYLKIKSICEDFYNNEFMPELDRLYQEKLLSEEEYKGSFNGVLTFILPIMFINFNEIKDKDFLSGSGNVINLYNEYVEENKNFLKHKHLFLKNSYSIKCIHFEEKNFKTIDLNKLNGYLAENLFFDAFNILVKCFLISKNENKLVNFYKNAFEDAKCFPYQKKHLTDFLEILQKRAIPWSSTFYEDMSFDDVLISNFLIKSYEYPSEKLLLSHDLIIESLVNDFVENTTKIINNDFNYKDIGDEHFSNYNKSYVYKTLYLKKRKNKNKEECFLSSISTKETIEIIFSSENIILNIGKLKEFFRKILIEKGHIQ
jgi:hypothetical protein